MFSDALHEGDRVLVATVAGRVTKRAWAAIKARLSCSVLTQNLLFYSPHPSVSPTHTTILCDDAALVSIPNAVVSGGTVVNFDHSGVFPVHADVRPSLIITLSSLFSRLLFPLPLLILF